MRMVCRRHRIMLQQRCSGAVITAVRTNRAKNGPIGW